MGTRSSVHGIGITVLAMVVGAGLYGCGDDGLGPESGVPAMITAESAPETAYSGSTITITVRVEDAAGGAVKGAEVAFTPATGSVDPAAAVTTAAGLATTAWTLADADGDQTLSVESEGIRRSVRVTTEPEIVALRLTARAELMPGWTGVASVIGTTPSGREVEFPAGVSLTVAAERRVYEELRVVHLDDRTVYADGPGEATLAATLGDLRAEAVVEVGRAPIAVSVTPAVVPMEGGAVTLNGYDLQDVHLFLGNRLVRPTQRTGRTIVFDVEPAPTACEGRSSRRLSVEPAYVAEPLTVSWDRDDLISLAPGEYMALGPSGSLCLRLPAVGDAEYAVGFFDTRGMVTARTEEEDYGLQSELVSFRIRDTSVPVPSQGDAAALAVPVPAPGGSAITDSGDVVLGAVAATDDDATRRESPWNTGDTFSVTDVFGLDPSRGTIFHATERFAFGVLERDAGYDIPARLEGTDMAVSTYSRYAEPLLREIFVDELPTTTAGSGQMLVVVGEWGPPGQFRGGWGLEDRGSWIAIDPGVAETSRDQPLHLSPQVLIHEMAHAYQDRHLMRRCIAVRDCSSGYWSHTWAVEGGAEFVTEVAMADSFGFSFTGNALYEGRIHNVYGLTSASGGYPHHLFSRGYGAATGVLRDFAVRAVRAGASQPQALRAVILGAWEGWYGHTGHHGPGRLGLTARMRALVGEEWDPAAAAALAVAAIAADDRVEDPAIQVPFLRNAWERHGPAHTFDLARGTDFEVDVPGISYGYYRIEDPDELGGTVRFDMDGNVVEWGVVRIR